MEDPTPELPDEFYVLKEGQIRGPYTAESLQAAVNAGAVTRDDFVQEGGSPFWRPLSAIAESAQEDEERIKGAIAPDWASIRRWAWLRFRYDLDEQSVGAGLACLAGGVVAFLMAQWPFLIWLPWFALAFIAGLGALRRQRSSQGIGLLVAAAALPIILGLLLSPRKAQPVESPGTAIPERSSPAAPAAKPPIISIPNPSSKAPGESRVRNADELKRDVPAVPAAEAPPVSKPEPSPVPPSISLPTPAPAAAPTPVPPPPAPAPKTGTAIDFSPAPTLSPPASANISALASTPLTPPEIPSLSPHPVVPKPSTSAGGDFVQEHRNAFVVVKDGGASGSGFVCRDAKGTWLYTNIHVAAAMRQPKFTRLDGSVIKVGAAEAAVGHDALRLPVTDAQAPLEVMSNLESQVRIDDAILVLGNSGGGGVVTNLQGKLVGIGPDRIEVDAEFIPGNSGSPIVHVPTGKVIGIATYLTQKYEQFAGNGARLGAESPVIRRFGYRLDSIQKWEPVNWTEFFAEEEQLGQIGKLTGDVFGFLDCLRTRKEPDFATETLRRPAVEWFAAIRKNHAAAADREKATAGFLGTLRSMVRADVAAAEARFRYSYFREQLAREKEVRDRLYKAFDEDLKRMNSTAGRF